MITLYKDTLIILINMRMTPPVDIPGSLELTRPGRGNFDLYEDGLAPQGWILSPEGGPRLSIFQSS